MQRYVPAWLFLIAYINEALIGGLPRLLVFGGPIASNASERIGLPLQRGSSADERSDNQVRCGKVSVTRAMPSASDSPSLRTKHQR